MPVHISIDPVIPHAGTYYPIFALDESDNVVGEVYVYLIGTERQGRYYAYIDDLKVSESMRGHGIARQLMEEAHKIARREKCYKVIANSHRKRKAARALYASLGYYAHGREFRLDLEE
jgi:GNAT superfamily N-acetyltransferase